MHEIQIPSIRFFYKSLSTMIDFRFCFFAFSTVIFLRFLDQATIFVNSSGWILLELEFLTIIFWIIQQHPNPMILITDIWYFRLYVLYIHVFELQRVPNILCSFVLPSEATSKYCFFNFWTTTHLSNLEIAKNFMI